MPKGRPSKVKWTKEQEETIRRLYAELGPKVLAERMGVPESCLTNRANYLGIKTDRNVKWTEGMLQVLRDRYQTDGPTKLSEELQVPYWSLVSKARSIGIGSTRKLPPKGFKWTPDKIRDLQQRYGPEGPQKFADEHGLFVGTVRVKAHELGLSTNAGHVEAGRIRAENSTRCDIHYFDEWSPNMAYILGHMFADGCVNSDLQSVSYCIAERDVKILDFIRREIKVIRRITIGPGSISPRTGNICQRSACFGINSTVMVRRLMELGLKPRKTYNDDPFPEIPDGMFPHFVRGEFDGDGCVHLAKEFCSVSFFGSPKFITGLRDSLIRLAGMSCRGISISHDKTDMATVTWSSNRDVRLFYEYVYFDDSLFCLERKRDKFKEWFSRERRENKTRKFWTQEEEQQVRDLYHVIGPSKLASLLDRECSNVLAKVRELGLKPINNRETWSEEELDLLRQRYLELGPRKMSQLLGKSWWNVRHRAESMGMKFRFNT